MGNGVDVARAARLWLQHAAETYGGELPVRAPGALVLGASAVVEVEPAANPAPAVADAEDDALGTPAIVAETAPTESHSVASRRAATGETTPAAPAAPMSGTTSRKDTNAKEVADPAGDSIAAPNDDPALQLAALRQHIGACTRCKLSHGRTQVVFGDGSARARVMFIGEAPGFHEDRQGLPFVGAAGQLLDRIIENAMGLRRADTYIANVNKCRPPENREPEPDEVAACLPFLRQQVRIIRPAVIVCLGRVASSNLLGTSLPMKILRGRELTYEGIPVVVTWHPAYLLRNPGAKHETWDDIKRVNRLLGRPECPARAAPDDQATRSP